MAVNNFKAFALGEDANVLTQAEYEDLQAKETGFKAGVAESVQLNKVWRQASVIAAVVAEFIVQQSGDDALDNGDLDALRLSLEKSLIAHAKSELDDRYLNIDKNLSDLADVKAARESLELGSAALLDVGTVKGSVAAADDTRIVNALLKSGNLAGLADTVKALANIGAFPAAGGVVGDNGVKSPWLYAGGNPYAIAQGTWIGWNESQGQGETDIICNAGTGVGGFVLRTVNATNTKELGRIHISGTGEITAGNNIQAGGELRAGGGTSTFSGDGNSYGTIWGGWLSNYLAAQLNNKVTGVRMAGTGTANNGNGGGSAYASAPAGAAVTAVAQETNWTGIRYMYMQFCVNGIWYNAGAV